MTEVLQTMWERPDQSRSEVLHDLWRDGGRRGDRGPKRSGDQGFTGEQSDQTAFATEVIPAITPPSL